MSGYLFASETLGSELRLRFIPVMVTRLLLSLRKAAATQDHGWSLGEPSNMRFAERRGGLVTRDEVIHLDIFTSTYEGIQSRES